MKLIRTILPDVVIIEPVVFEDERGWFMESFNEGRFHSELESLGLPIPGAFVQDNHSFSRKGVLRGLHYQRPPHEQGKLVRVTQGAAWDVAVDIRPSSATFGRWVSETLSAKNKKMLWIPKGFAHGFIALEDTHFLYKSTGYYDKDSEETINWRDPFFNISWPECTKKIISEKDREAKFFS